MKNNVISTECVTFPLQNFLFIMQVHCLQEFLAFDNCTDMSFVTSFFGQSVLTFAMCFSSCLRLCMVNLLDIGEHDNRVSRNQNTNMQH